MWKTFQKCELLSLRISLTLSSSCFVFLYCDLTFLKTSWFHTRYLHLILFYIFFLPGFLGLVDAICKLYSKTTIFSFLFFLHFYLVCVNFFKFFYTTWNLAAFRPFYRYKILQPRILLGHVVCHRSRNSTQIVFILQYKYVAKITCKHNEIY